jgi:hypothetical protein
MTSCTWVSSRRLNTIDNIVGMASLEATPGWKLDGT